MQLIFLCVCVLSIYWLFMWWITRPRTVASQCPECQGKGYANSDTYFDCPSCKGTGVWVYKSRIYCDHMIWVK